MNHRWHPGLHWGLLATLFNLLKPVTLVNLIAMLALIASVSLIGNACAPFVRPYYSRELGSYFRPDPSLTPTAEVPDSLEGNGSVVDRLQKISESYLGVPYQFGGQSRSGMDCSGFIGQVFMEACSLKLPRSSARMFRSGKPISRADLKPGDVVFFKRFGFIDHSGLYMGKNHFIHSATSVGVSYSTLSAPYFRSHYAGARRFVDAP